MKEVVAILRCGSPINPVVEERGVHLGLRGGSVQLDVRRAAAEEVGAGGARRVDVVLGCG